MYMHVCIYIIPTYPNLLLLLVDMPGFLNTRKISGSSFPVAPVSWLIFQSFPNAAGSFEPPGTLVPPKGAFRDRCFGRLRDTLIGTPLGMSQDVDGVASNAWRPWIWIWGSSTPKLCSSRTSHQSHLKNYCSKVSYSFPHPVHQRFWKEIARPV